MQYIDDLSSIIAGLHKHNLFITDWGKDMSLQMIKSLKY